MMGVLVGVLTTGAVAATDFSGMWEMADMALVKRPDENRPQWTPAAAKRLQYYKNTFSETVDDPARFCVIKGMPWTITSRARTYVTEIHQTPTQLFAFFEFQDNRRVVHLDGRQKPANWSPSSEGFSAGRWEGDTLVIETTGLVAHHELSPHLRSAQARVVERWRLLNDPTHGEVIDIDVTVYDPEVFAEPGRGRQVFKRAAPDAVRSGYNCEYEIWERHVEESIKPPADR
jgi:hypothetical protein